MHVIGSNISANDTVKCSNTPEMNLYSTLYWWSVNVTDSSGNWSNITYRFTTVELPVPSNEPVNPRPEDNSTNINRSIVLAWDCSDPSYPVGGDFFDLSNRWTTISGNPTNRHGLEPVRKTRIVQVNKTIDGAVRKYVGYDSNAGGSQIRLYYTDEVDGQWTPYSGNPILSTGTVRCPTTTYDNGTFHMFIYAGSRFDRWTSTDGINYVYQEEVADTGGIANACIWFNPNDDKWYFYHTDWTGNKWAAVRNSTDIEDLDSAPMTLNDLDGVTIWSTMYWHEKYWFVGELFDGGTWTVRAFYGDYPDKDMTLCDNAPILTDYEACPRLCIMENGSKTYLFSNRDSSWYQDTREVYGANLTYDVYFGTTSSPPKVVSNQSGDIYSPGLLDYDTQYYWRVVAWNPTGGKNVSVLWNFTTEPSLADASPPVITSVADVPDPQEIGGYVNISCDVSDNVAVDEVWVNVTYPYPDASTTNVTMLGGSYYYNVTYDQVGIHSYYIWANDTSGNSNQSSIYSFIIQEPVVSWWNTDWMYRKEITINHSKVDADLTNFPVLISLTSDSDLADGSKCQPDGDDIVFTNASGNKLNHEIELFNDSTGELVAWVNVTSLSSTMDTVLYMYYGNSGCGNQENVAGTWDSSYKMVHHLNEISGDHLDSTSFDNDGSPSVTVQGSAVGMVDGADEFDGIADYVDCGSDASLVPVDITVESWIKPGTISGSHAVVEHYEWGAGEGGYLFRQVDDDVFWDILEGTTDHMIWANDILQTDVWTHIIGTFEGSSITIYINGNYYNHLSWTGTIAGVDTNLAIGARGDDHSANFFDGLIDEVRISDVARGAGWINSSYLNQYDPDGFYSVGSEETSNGDPWWDTDWSYRKEITINHSKVDADFINFPVLISFASDQNLANHAQNNGDDVAFTNVSDNQLNHEIEYFDDSSGELVCWVNVTKLSSTEDTFLYMYYGNPSSSNQENPSGVWDSSFVGVYHLNQDISGTGNADVYKDSTSNNYHGWDNISDSGKSGVAGDGQTLDGSDDYIDFGDLPVSDDATVNVWINNSSTFGSTMFLAGDWLDIMYNNYGLFWWDDWLDHGLAFFSGSGSDNYLGGNYWNDGSWHMITGLRDGGTDRLYVNASEQCSNSVGSQSNLDKNWHLGAAAGGQWACSGSVDELRISNIRRSDGWLNTTYNTIKNHDSFFSVGSENTSSLWHNSYPVNSNPSPSDGATGVSIPPSNFSIKVNDADGNHTMNLTFRTNESGSWQDAQTNNSVTNGTYYLTNKSWVDTGGKTYWWSVNTSDGHGGWDNDTHSFTTYTYSLNTSSPSDNYDMYRRETQAFTVEYSDVSDVTWYLDGVQQQTNDSVWSASWTYTFDRLGLHRVSASATNGGSWVNHSWSVLTVVNFSGGVHKYDEPLMLPNPDGWEDGFIFDFCLWLENGTYHLYYAGDNIGDREIGYANSSDGFSWTKYSGNPILSPGPASSWDDKEVFWTPGIEKINGTYWYIIMLLVT
ncbi:protein of unknown function (DUF2341) [Thermoplasmatales archaeon SCGC AB-540-F20]|nr:protein of unknown function (DUF2341) [Thermoplasmatales archaeon SCGC AB-540-F20]